MHIKIYTFLRSDIFYGRKDPRKVYTWLDMLFIRQKETDKIILRP